MNWEITTFIAYFVILLGVALVFYFNGTNKNSEDFFLGGRSMGPWVTALSAQASDMSAWLLMGLPGSILAFGFGQMWIGIGLAIGTAANWILCAKRLRTFSKAANDSITLPQYLTNRFAVDSRALQLVCALIFLFAYTIYVASALVAGTSVFTTLFPDISPKIAMFAFLLIIVAYTFFGGFAAVCWTDFFQGLLMMAALMLVPIVVYFGHSELLDPTALETVYEYTDAATGAVTQCAFGGGIFNASWQDIVSGLGWGLGYFGMPHILVRFMSIEKPSMIKKSSIVAIIWVVISLFSAVLTVVHIAEFSEIIYTDCITGAQKSHQIKRKAHNPDKKEYPAEYRYQHSELSRCALAVSEYKSLYSHHDKTREQDHEKIVAHKCRIIQKSALYPHH